MGKILVVEDEEILAEILSMGLGADGHTVITASDGVAGFDAVRTENPDLIVTDMSLPKMTGWELIEKLRAEPSTAALPIIAMTGHRTAEDRSAAFAAGVSAYQQKPIDMGLLKAKITELLGT